MEKEEKENYIKAGKIHFEAVQEARKLLKPNSNLYDAAEKIEALILKEGGKCAFPVNLSLNENAAHQTPEFDGKLVLDEKDLLKVDIGVHVDGFISDGAFSINHSGEWKDLIEASELAKDNAFALLEKNPNLGEIGATIQKTIESKGFNPVQNLSGHGLAQYMIHCAPSIPNYKKSDDREFEDDDAYAIEPFATNGEGFIREGNESNIFAIEEPHAVRNSYARKILSYVMEEYKTLPFAERWIERDLKLDEFGLKIGMKQLLREKCIKAFPVLREKPGTMVSQAENSFIKVEGKIITLSKSGEKNAGTNSRKH